MLRSYVMSIFTEQKDHRIKKEGAMPTKFKHRISTGIRGALAGALLVLAACGGGSGGGSTAAPPVVVGVMVDKSRLLEISTGVE